MSKLKNKTILITGASRGIGREMALRFARDGANIVIAAKTSDAHIKLPGTIHSVAQEVIEAGGQSLAIQVDVRDEANVKKMFELTAEKFGGLDVLINNAGAIQLSPTDATPMKRYDLMNQVNARAVFLCSQAGLSLLKESPNPHILNLSPPINLDTRWISPHVAYTISKYGMTLCTLGMAEEFKIYGIAVNSLWPRFCVYTAATKMLMGEAAAKHMRTPAIMSDAAYAIVTSENRTLTGQTLLDEDFLRSLGETNFDQYAVEVGAQLIPDAYV